MFPSGEHIKKYSVIPPEANEIINHESVFQHEMNIFKRFNNMNKQNLLQEKSLDMDVNHNQHLNMTEKSLDMDVNHDQHVNITEDTTYTKYAHANKFSALSDDSSDTEVEFVEVQSRKRRKSQSISQSTQFNLPKSINPNSSTAKSNSKMPPIIVRDKLPHINYFKDLRNITSEHTIIQYRSPNNSAIYTFNDKDHEVIMKKLTADKLQYYTYPKSNLNKIKLVSKGIPPFVEKEEIIDYLQNKGIKTRNIIQMTKTVEKSKYKLPIHIIILEPEQNINDIKRLNHVMGYKVTWEKLISSGNNILQCYRCQNFGHTSAYCNLKFRCVKCRSDHQPGKCEKRVDQAPECVNCGMEHPANYKKCLYLEEIIHKRTNNQIKRSNQISTNNISYVMAPKPKPLTRPFSEMFTNKSFPTLSSHIPTTNQSSRHTDNSSNHPNNSNPNLNVNEMLQTINELKILFSDNTVKNTINTLLNLAKDIKNTTCEKDKQMLVFQCFLTLCT